MFPEIMRDEVFRLETARLWLRWPRASDAAAVTATAGDAGVAEMTSHIPHPYPEGEALRHIVRTRSSNETGASCAFVITRKARPGIAIGMIELRIEGQEAPTAGYFLGRSHWGQGLATEALQTLVAAAFLLAPIAAVAASARSSNPASRRAQEKCGFVYTGSDVRHFPARGEMVAVDQLVLTRERWAGLSPLGVGRATAASLADQRTFGAACL